MSAAHPLIALGVHAFFRLGRILRQRALREENRRWERPDPLQAGRSLQALARDYAGYDIIAGILFFLLTPPLVFLWLDLFQAVGDWAAPDLGADGRLLGPSVWTWAVPALFAGLASVAWPLHLLMRSALTERYEEYLFYANKVAGFDSFKVVKVMLVGSAAIALLGALILASTFTAFLDDRIIVKGVLAEPHSHSYQDIVAIRTIAGVAAVAVRDRRPGHYEILFRDGSLWRSTDGLRDSDPHCDYHAVVLAALRSGRRISGLDIRVGESSGAACG